MRDQGGSLDERAFSVLFAFHFVTDLAFSQPFSIGGNPPPPPLAAVVRGGPVARRVMLVNQ
jgi:hypothetical protein